MDGKAYITGEVIRQIRTQMQNGEGDYFEDYEKNAVEEFDPGQFYLTPRGWWCTTSSTPSRPIPAGFRCFSPLFQAAEGPRC